MGSITNTSGGRREPIGRISGRHRQKCQVGIKFSRAMAPPRPPPRHSLLSGSRLLGSRPCIPGDAHRRLVANARFKDELAPPNGLSFAAPASSRRRHRNPRRCSHPRSEAEYRVSLGQLGRLEGRAGVRVWWACRGRRTASRAARLLGALMTASVGSSRRRRAARLGGWHRPKRCRAPHYCR